VKDLKKSEAEVSIYNFNKLRRSGNTRYFGPQPKLGAGDDSLIHLSDEGEE
jgi:hypothetical protein